MTKRNMKIEINESQPLDEVVRELERLGYVLENDYDDVRHACCGVIAWTNTLGGFAVIMIDREPTTTIAELKQMV